MAPTTKRILVVDDSPVVLMLLAASLEQEGLEVETAADGEQTLRAVAERRPHLILSDIEMPGIGGFELLERLREFDPTLRVALLSGARAEHDLQRASDLGADAFFLKTGDLSPVVRYVLDSFRN